MSQVFHFKSNPCFKNYGNLSKVYLLCLIYYPLSHIIWNSMIWRFFLKKNHEVGDSIKQQESALLLNIDIFAKRRKMDKAEWGCLLQVWCELQFCRSAGRVEIKNRWVLEAGILCFRKKVFGCGIQLTSWYHSPLNALSYV